jgi:tetratricopeptide (TPR) repeat protein
MTAAMLLVLAGGGSAFTAPGPAPSGAVRAWEGHLDLPTYEEGSPDVNPPFDLFETRRYNYPYTLRENLTDRRATARWRTLEIENAYLHCTVLPDLGGHLYGCVDKANGAQMFYANTAIKKARVAYRGAWAALGVEFNFPVSHNWATASPVDHAITRNPDGSATLWVGNVDRVYGMQWRVGLTLRPGSSALEQDVTLYNPTDTRHRFYWWNNAGVQVWDDSRIEYPMRFTASHGFKAIDTWPVNQAGVDLSVVGNHTAGVVSEFSHASREAFMGVYHPRTQAGVVHYSSTEDAPTKKIWSWGGDADGLDWRKALSDDESAYVEVQAGLFRNQETYAFLEPQESIRFTEHWLPVRGTGGITRATPDAVVYVARTPAAPGTVDLAVALDVTRAVRGGVLLVKDGPRVVGTVGLVLTPAEVLKRTFTGLPEAPRYTVEVRSGGTVLLSHTEDRYDMLPDAAVRVGPQPEHVLPPRDRRSEGDVLEAGDDQERNGKRLPAWTTYQDGLGRFPDSLPLLRAAGRLAVDLARYAEAADLLQKAAARATTDPAIRYHLGLARAGLGDEARARTEWEAARPFRAFAAAATLKLAQLDARAGDRARALRRVRESLTTDGAAVRLGAVEVALLRHAGRASEAGKRLAHWRALDPTASILRYEAVRLGRPDEALWTHLGADPQRVLNLAVEYMALGLWADAVDLLGRRYPVVTGLATEPGAVPPQDDPEVAYYRGYCRERSGGSGASDYAAASRMSTRYVFPSRPESFVVLRRALESRPDDATARFLLGALLLASGRADDAVREWQETRRLDPRIPVLHRNLGRTLLQVSGDVEGALAVLSEGVEADPANVDVYYAADQAMSLLGRPAAERVALFRRFPAASPPPPELRQRLALALAEVGQADEAESLLAGQFFPREEWGTNVRQVFVEIRLQKALALARAGRSADALGIVNALEQEVPGYAFTKDGLGAFVRTPRTQYVAGEIAALAGDAAAARAHWTAAVEGKESFFRGPAWSYLAARRLGNADEAGWRARLEAALSESDAFLEGGTNFPGVVVQAQGMMLHVLGRRDEAAVRLQKALVLPDQRLSHFLARRALADAP